MSAPFVFICLFILFLFFVFVQFFWYMISDHTDHKNYKNYLHKEKKITPTKIIEKELSDGWCSSKRVHRVYFKLDNQEHFVDVSPEMGLRIKEKNSLTINMFQDVEEFNKRKEPLFIKLIDGPTDTTNISVENLGKGIVKHIYNKKRFEVIV